MANNKEQAFNQEEEMNGQEQNAPEETRQENQGEDTSASEGTQAEANAGEAADASETKEGQSGESELEQKEREYKELHEKYLRLYSEFENFRRRTRKEVEDAKDKGRAEVVTAVLPVLDDFERSLLSIKDSSESEEVYQGVELIYNKLKNLLQEKGLQEMEALGQAFDPEYHEAMTKTQAPSKEEKGKVIDEIEKGYFLNDKIVRHAKVVVGE